MYYIKIHPLYRDGQMFVYTRIYLILVHISRTFQNPTLSFFYAGFRLYFEFHLVSPLKRLDLPLTS